jgi:tRNA U54 and U55 pseudouridine synthase Pus10
MDRLFFTEKLHRAILEKKCDAVYRLQDKALYIKSFIRNKKRDTTINLLNGRKVRRGTPNSVKFRMVKYTVNDKLYVLGTTLLDKKKFSIDNISQRNEIYRSRWDIEEHFKLFISSI